MPTEPRPEDPSAPQRRARVSNVTGGCGPNINRRTLGVWRVLSQLESPHVNNLHINIYIYITYMSTAGSLGIKATEEEGLSNPK